MTTDRNLNRLCPLRALATVAFVGIAAACAGHSGPATAPKPGDRAAGHTETRSAPALFLAPISSQPIPILPVTYLVSGDSIAGLPMAHADRLRWSDSMLTAALEARGPEVHWLSPIEVRRVARRAPGLISDPDHMTQSVMRFDRLDRVPDPLLGNLRTLVALTNSRYVMIPAELRFTRSAGGEVVVSATLVLVDARLGSVAWRSHPSAAAATASAAFLAMIVRILPTIGA